ncbi:hypothetical protein [Alloalcanivorax venustensis]|uniref:hypothetical protein n=1 Tax=Alloalcanivorax venustensis TaxID=172371 RepID=UPI0039C09073
MRGKAIQYKKYFQYIDESSEAARNEIFFDLGEKKLDIIINPSEENTIAYVQSTLISQKDIGDRFLKFKTEIDGLRLEAGDNLLRLLDSYTEALEQVQNETITFMGSLNQNPERFVRANSAISKEITGFMQALS